MLCNDDSCTGCGTCVNICPKDCIYVQYDKNGFLMPYINDKECIRCGRCDDICPILNTVERGNYAEPVCYAGWNKDEKVRQYSTSGGIFSALAEYVFSLGGIVCGVVLDHDLRPYHTVATCMNEINKMRGSKYLQSDTKLIFRRVKEALLLNKYVLFSGCPCQVVGLYAFLRDRNKEYDRLITCEVICHGVPSTKVFSWYKTYLEEKAGSPIINVNFRSKKYGWQTVAIGLHYLNSKKETIKASNSLFFRAFYSSLIVRESCTECLYASLPRNADITIGDYWHAVVQNYSNKNRKKGISLILVNNSKAVNIISALQDKIFFEPITLQDATADNTNINSLEAINPKRNDFLREFSSSNINYMMNKYFPITFKDRISIILGRKMIYRVKYFLKLK
ncbi:MAG TPA: hypothetical protein DCK76_06165 [Desulfotomaculum sp.]|nr:MAG: 4Fe-4S ferredoxin iron-sulfur binding domain-containing protein [Desulfotomaculum sp. 46_80]HAG10959.1 hypothetical protein [Desulfotomaculum sp.]